MTWATAPRQCGCLCRCPNLTAKPLTRWLRTSAEMVSFVCEGCARELDATEALV